MFKFLFKKKKHNLEDVFTPSSAAKLTYIERLDLKNQIERALMIPGMQLIVYGHSGGGKTTLIHNTLNRKACKYISTNCMLTTKIDEIILDAFDKLNPYYISDQQTKSIATVSSELKTKYIGICSLIKSELTQEQSQNRSRVLPIQLTPQRLAEFMGAAEVIWIIEDFHKVDITERQKFSQILKIFVDTSNIYKKGKVIAIGAVGTAREIINYDSELTNRVSEIFVPLMKPAELDSIIRKGEQFLNIDFNTNSHQEIIKFSNSLAAICHQICFSMCYNNQILKTQIHKKNLREDKLQQAVVDYLKQNSDSFKETYDRAIKTRDDKIENPKSIIQAFCNIQKEELSLGEIGNYKGLKKKFKGNLQQQLQLLTTSEYGEILRFDNNSGKYFFSNPFFKAYSIMRLASEDEDRFKPRHDYDIDRIKVLLEIMDKNNAVIFKRIEMPNGRIK